MQWLGAEVEAPASWAQLAGSGTWVVALGLVPEKKEQTAVAKLRLAVAAGMDTGAVLADYKLWVKGSRYSLCRILTF